MDFDTSSIGSIRFRIRIYYTPLIAGYSTTSSYTRSSWIRLYTAAFEVVSYVIAPATGVPGTGGTNYVMLLDADATGADDTHFSNVYRIDPFTCDTASGCPDPATPSPIWYASSSTTGAILPHGTVPYPTFDAVSGKWGLSVTTSTLTTYTFYLAAAIGKDDGADACA